MRPLVRLGRMIVPFAGDFEHLRSQIGMPIMPCLVLTRKFGFLKRTSPASEQMSKDRAYDQHDRVFPSRASGFSFPE